MSAWRPLAAAVLLGPSWTAWGVVLLCWGLGQGLLGGLAALAGAVWLDQWAGPGGGFWTWTALGAWTVLAADREEGRPTLWLRVGVVLLVSLLVGRVVWGRFGWPGGVFALARAGAALWVIGK